MIPERSLKYNDDIKWLDAILLTQEHKCSELYLIAFAVSSKKFYQNILWNDPSLLNDPSKMIQRYV